MKPFHQQLVWTLAAVLLYAAPLLVAQLAPGAEWFRMVAGVVFGAVWVPRPHEVAAKRASKAP